MLTIKADNIDIQTQKNIITTNDITITFTQSYSDRCIIQLITKIPLYNLVITYEDDSIKDIESGVVGRIGITEYDGYFDEDNRVVFEMTELTDEMLSINYFVLDSKNIQLQSELRRAGIKYAKNNDTVVTVYETRYLGSTPATNYIVTQDLNELIPTKIKIKHQVPYDLTIITSEHIHQITDIYDEQYYIDMTNYDTITCLYISKEEQTSSSVYDEIIVEGTIKPISDISYNILQESQIIADNTIRIFGYKEIFITDDIQLDLDYEIINEKKEYYKDDEFEIKFTRNTEYYVIDKPVITILLPEEIDYVDSYLEYTSLIDEITYISTNKDYPMEIVEPIIIPSYKGTTQTAIRFTFTTQFQNYDSLTIALKLKIASEDIPILSFVGYIGNYQSTFNVDKTEAIPFVDILDLDDDEDISERIVMTSDVIVNIAKDNIDIDFKTLGNQDVDYTTNSITSSGSNINYLLTITNNNDSALNNIEIIDILPNMLDTYNTSTNSRNSEYRIYLNNEINSTTISNNISKDEVLDIYYSGIDPVRFDESNNAIGNDLWVKDKEYTSIESIKILKDTLNPGEQLQIIIPAMTSLDSTTIANNTIAIRASLDDNIIIKESSITTTSINNQNLNISGYVWLDNGDGIYNNETTLNNISIYLLDENQNILSKTITTPCNGVDGYYKFNNLQANNYYITSDTSIYTYTKQIDSKINIDTRISELINLNEDQIIQVGLIDIIYPVINVTDKIVYLNDSYDPLDGITAYDEFNNDISSNITVTKNTVDTSKEGTYIVIYEVKDDYNLVTTKTVNIIVTNYDITHAKIALIESVALQQTSLSYILNAEGDKIKKVLETKNIADILKTNKSLNNMVNAITQLELILHCQLMKVKKID